MANKLLTKDEIVSRLFLLDDTEGRKAGYCVGDCEIIRKIDGNSVRYTTADLLMPMEEFSNRILKPLLAYPRKSKDVVSEITAARGSVYGPFLHNAVVAQGLKAVMRNVPDPDNEGRHWHRLPADVREALDLIALKISRIVTGDPEYLDNFDDIAGYATIVAKRIRGGKKDA